MELKHGLEVIAAISLENPTGSCYEAESFMCDVALHYLNRWEERSDPEWDLETYVDQIKRRFKIDWDVIQELKSP